MKTWIHFIGKQYYTINQFIREAERIGVMRAVSPTVLKQMDFGDRVMLVQKDGASSKIFGYFIFTQITGLKLEVITALGDGVIQRMPAMTPMPIQRGCGQYTVTAQYQIMDSSKLMYVIRNLNNDDFDRIMVGGKFYPLSEIGISTDYVLCNIPFRQGFRRFDFDAFYNETSMSIVPARHLKIKGQFYVMKEQIEEQREFFQRKLQTELIQIQNYQLN